MMYTMKIRLQLCIVAEKGHHRPRTPPELPPSRSSDSSVSTTALFEENTCPVAAHSIRYYTAGDAPAMHSNGKCQVKNSNTRSG